MDYAEFRSRVMTFCGRRYAVDLSPAEDAYLRDLFEDVYEDGFFNGMNDADDDDDEEFDEDVENYVK